MEGFHAGVWSMGQVAADVVGGRVMPERKRKNECVEQVEIQTVFLILLR